MSVVIGIDIGGSTTKIVGFNNNGELITPMFVRATDPITSIYGAFGKFTDINNLELDSIRKVMITGVGSSYMSKPLYGLECVHVSEFESVGLGGMYLSGLDNAVIVSMGTGTAIVHAKKDSDIHYLGGTGVGGGTLIGLSKKLLDVSKIESIVELASSGDLSKVDLRINDITRKDILPGMSDELTASNFGKINDLATKNDLALGLVNMVFESEGMLAVFASRNCGTKDIVLTGNLTGVPQAKPIFDSMSKLFNVNFIIPKYSQFATVIGAALSDRSIVPERMSSL